MCRPVKSRSGARREEIPGWTAVKDSKAWYREIQIIWPIFGLSWDRGWPLLNWGKFYNISDSINKWTTKEYHAIPKLPTIQSRCRLFRNQEVWSKDLWSNELSGPRSCRSWRPIQKICNDFYFPCKMKGMQCGESYPNVKCIQGMWRSVAICATKQLPLPFPRQFFMFDSSPLVFYPVGMICLVTMVTSLYQK